MIQARSGRITRRMLATGALLSVKLVREPCSDGMSETQYTFKVIVEHAQIGTLNGCGQSAPDKFPEFRKKEPA